jgi:hypothetical protein
VPDRARDRYRRTMLTVPTQTPPFVSDSQEWKLAWGTVTTDTRGLMIRQLPLRVSMRVAVMGQPVAVAENRAIEAKQPQLPS